MISNAASAETLHSGFDIQATIATASPGDTIIVGPGEHDSFEVDKPLSIQGKGWPVLHAAIQNPGIIVRADGVSISGFRIEGVGKDSQSKFNYYMNNPAAAAGQRLNLPNCAILVQGNEVNLKDIAVFGAQVGVWAEFAAGIRIQNSTFESCERGVGLYGCRFGSIEGCKFYSCDKVGLDLDQCENMVLCNNSIVNTTNAGLMLKESERCILSDNLLSENREGLFLWNSSLNNISKNRAMQNYYGITLSGSHNNTVIENAAEENNRNDIISGFGVGISLQENSSFNVVAKNIARKNFNGLEMTKGCRLNVAYGNDASDNKHGIRMDKNYNNLIYGNNFARNVISAYDNASHNYWNTTIGNYYSDYRGRDEDGDGIGDQPYTIPMGDHDEADLRPLMKPYTASEPNLTALMSEVESYAAYVPADTNTITVEGGTVVISAKRPSSPPTWSKSEPLFDDY